MMENAVQSLAELGVRERDLQARDFSRLAALVMLTKGAYGEAARAAQQFRAGPRVEGILKAAVEAGTVGNGHLGDYGVVASAFLGALASAGAYDAVKASGAVSVPTGARTFEITSAILAGSDVEARARAISKIEATPGSLTPQAVTGLIVVTEELVRLGAQGVGSFIEKELRRAVVTATDNVFLPAMAVSAASVPGSSDAFADIADAAAVMAIDSSARLVVVAPAPSILNIALSLASGGSDGVTAQGGVAAGIRFVASDLVPSGSPANAMVIDASQVLLVDEGIVIDDASDTSLQMDNSPSMSGSELGSPSAPTATSVVNLFQTNSRALRAVRYIAFDKARDTAVCMISGIGW